MSFSLQETFAHTICP